MGSYIDKKWFPERVERQQCSYYDGGNMRCGSHFGNTVWQFLQKEKA